MSAFGGKRTRPYYERWPRVERVGGPKGLVNALTNGPRAIPGGNIVWRYAAVKGAEVIGRSGLYPADKGALDRARRSAFEARR